MLGNDVVDLRDTESRHPRFDVRVFDATERALIKACSEPERTRWLFWAAKESAYKAARKEDPWTMFSPPRFAVRPDSDGRLRVTIGNREFRVHAVVDAEHVHTVARRVGDPADALCSAIARADGDSSVAVRLLAIATVAAHLAVPFADLAIVRDGRIPTLWYRGRRSDADLSLSHHGRFVAFACADMRA